MREHKDRPSAEMTPAVITVPHMQEWIEAAKAEPDEVVELLDVEF